MRGRLLALPEDGPRHVVRPEREEPALVVEPDPVEAAAHPVDDVLEAAPVAATLEDPGQRRDLRLVDRTRAGDLDAFNELVVHHQDHLFGLVARMVPDRDQAADAVQEAFFNAFRHLGSFRGGSVRGWLCRIAVNAALDAQRAHRRRPVGPYPELDDDSWQPPSGAETDPEQLTIDREQSRFLADALGRIAADQRTAIVLFDVEGYDYGEIAAMTRVSLGTVKSRIHRGRLALRSLLAEARTSRPEHPRDPAREPSHD